MGYNIFTDILPVRGYSRGLFYDFGKQKLKFAPNTLLDFFKGNNYVDKNDLPQEYLDFLLREKFVFEISNRLKDCFPKLSNDYDSYSIIRHLLIEIDFETRLEELETTISFIENELYCYHLILIIKEDLSYHKELICNLVKSNTVDNFESIGIKSFVDKSETINEILVKTKKITNFYIVDKKIDIIHKDLDFERQQVYRVPVKSNENYNFVSSELFSINLSMYSESQKHNTYFNRKLYIKSNGEIKSSVESQEMFGYLHEIKKPEELKAIISRSNFQKYWFVHKEICDVCKDCEFRHMCVDNRLPFQREDGTWYHKEECNYNPYICKWRGEEGYLSLKECGVTSNESGFNINHEKIEAINKILWKKDKETESA
ncbi:MAG: hypothetical protein COB15_11600 [Flavobacteriales bacterium]|nr:MAG: hypothetical protein COB15_11600 [Flavobacteriales bacterium]